MSFFFDRNTRGSKVISGIRSRCSTEGGFRWIRYEGIRGCSVPSAPRIIGSRRGMRITEGRQSRFPGRFDLIPGGRVWGALRFQWTMGSRQFRGRHDWVARSGEREGPRIVPSLSGSRKLLSSDSGTTLISHSLSLCRIIIICGMISTRKPRRSSHSFHLPRVRCFSLLLSTVVLGMGRGEEIHSRNMRAQQFPGFRFPSPPVRGAAK